MEAAAPLDTISALRRDVAQASASLESTRQQGPPLLVSPIGRYVPPTALRAAIQDANLLALGEGPTWALTPGAAVKGENMPMALEYKCADGGGGAIMPKTTIRATEDGTWRGMMPGSSTESSYSSLENLLGMFIKTASTKVVACTPTPTGVLAPHLITSYTWVGERYLGKDGQPETGALTAELGTRNRRAVAVASTHMRGIAMDKQPYSQPHVSIWRLALPGSTGALLLGSHVATSTYFLCSESTAQCAYSVEDLLAVALCPRK